MQTCSEHTMIFFRSPLKASKSRAFSKCTEVLRMLDAWPSGVRVGERCSSRIFLPLYTNTYKYIITYIITYSITYIITFITHYNSYMHKGQLAHHSIFGCPAIGRSGGAVLHCGSLVQIQKSNPKVCIKLKMHFWYIIIFDSKLSSKLWTFAHLVLLEAVCREFGSAKATDIFRVNYLNIRFCFTRFFLFRQVSGGFFAWKKAAIVGVMQGLSLCLWCTHRGFFPWWYGARETHQFAINSLIRNLVFEPDKLLRISFCMLVFTLIYHLDLERWSNQSEARFFNLHFVCTTLRV